MKTRNYLCSATRFSRLRSRKDQTPVAITALTSRQNDKTNRKFCRHSQSERTSGGMGFAKCARLSIGDLTNWTERREFWNLGIWDRKKDVQHLCCNAEKSSFCRRSTQLWYTVNITRAHWCNDELSHDIRSRRTSVCYYAARRNTTLRSIATSFTARLVPAAL